MTEPLFNVNDGPNGRTGGPYLDQIELRDAEIRRAAAEGREPDFTNMIGTPGVPLVTAAELAARHHAQPSEHDKPMLDATGVLINADNPEVGANPMTYSPGPELESVNSGTAVDKVQVTDNIEVKLEEDPFVNPSSDE